MAKLSDCATIFQLAFAVNAVIPAITIAYRTTQENMVRRLANDVKRLKPELAINENDMPEFVDFVLNMNPGLRGVSYAGVGLKCAAAISLIISFFGLAFAATDPTAILSDWLLWTFAVYALIVSPGLLVMYRASLKFDEREMGRLWSRNEKAMTNTVACFKEMTAKKIAETPDIETEIRQLEAEVERRMAKIKNPLTRKFFNWLRQQ